MSVDVSAQFDGYVEDISIGEPQTSRMESAASAIIDFLMGKYGLPSENFFLQGSYPNGTAVEPVGDGEYDIDLVAVCVDGSTTANQALDELAGHFASDGRYKDRVRRKKPCVRLEYAPDDVGRFHVDVVPVRSTGTYMPPLEAPRRDEGWHGTAPAEYTAWCLQQGELFSRTVRILKRWRDEQQSVRTSIKSIVLQVLIAQHMPLVATEGDRVAETIRSMHQALSPLASAPRIENPVYPDEDLAARWTPQSFRDFVGELGEAVEWVNKAEGATDLVEACDAWRELLGDSFPVPESSSLGLQLEDVSHEKSFGTMGWGWARDSTYSIRISAQQQRGKRGQTRRPYHQSGSPVFAGHRLRFKATIYAPGHAEVWWQVTNTGAHATHEQALRGSFLRAKSINQGISSDPTEHWESTAYTGVHRVRAVLVRDDNVVAVSNYINVNIWSPNWRTRFGLI